MASHAGQISAVLAQGNSPPSLRNQFPSLGLILSLKVSPRNQDSWIETLKLIYSKEEWALLH